MAWRDKKDSTIEEIMEIHRMDAEVCKKLHGEYTDDGRCMIRLRHDEERPYEAHLEQIKFKSAGRTRG